MDWTRACALLAALLISCGGADDQLDASVDAGALLDAGGGTDAAAEDGGEGDAGARDAGPLDGDAGAALGEHRFGTRVPGRSLPYWGTANLDVGHPSATRAVITVHGTNRSADEYFERMRVAAEMADATADTVIVAPHFVIDDDAPAADVLYWDSNGGWKRGDLSSSTPPERVSSFEVVDDMMRALGDPSRFPAIVDIVVVGHSAGGQLVQRLALGATADLTVTHASFRFVPMNPSSYAYLDDRRSVGGSTSSFAVPTTTCSSYDEWRYGLTDLNAYMSAIGADTARARYRMRDVVYMLGEDDDDPTDPNLDTTCGALLQGAQRLERGRIFFGSVEAHYGSQPHRLVTVPGVGHSSSRMFRSVEARPVIFAR